MTTPTDTRTATLTEHEAFIRRTLRGRLRDENEVQPARAGAGAPTLAGTGLGVAAVTAVAAGLGAWAWTTSGSGGARGDVDGLAEVAAVSGPARTQRTATETVRHGALPEQDDQRAGAVDPNVERHLQLAPATLLDRSYYDSYELATFSFLHGTRDDPDLRITRNDWDLSLSGSQFYVNTVVDDRSRIVDLTAISPHEIGVALDWGFEFTSERIDVHQDHTYVILTRDADSSLATVLHVTEYIPGRRCVFEWLSTDGTGRTKGSLPDEHFGETRLSDVLRDYRSQHEMVTPMAGPRVQLQLRSGAVGGHPIRLMLNGEHTRVDAVAAAPLDLDGDVPINAPQVAYYLGGSIPEGKRFVVTDVTYRGSARGDRNGGGAFKIVLGGETIVDHDSTDEPIEGKWRGETSIERGGEAETYFEISNSSVGEVIVEGRFEDSDEATHEARSWAENEGFFGDVTALVTKRVAANYVPLEGREIRLQVRADAGGGNPNKIDLRGRTSPYVDHERDAPLDFTEEVTVNTPSETYFVGGAIPEGKVFVVTSVEYDAVAKGDNNGNGYVKLRVGGRTILDIKGGASELGGLWRGRLVLRPNEESRTFVEVGNSSTADIVIRGRLR